MPARMAYVMAADVARFARFAEKVWGVEKGEPEAMAKEGLARYRAWIKSLGMPLTFAELGARAGDIPLLAANLGLKEGQTLLSASCAPGGAMLFDVTNSGKVTDSRLVFVSSSEV